MTTSSPTTPPAPCPTAGPSPVPRRWPWRHRRLLFAVGLGGFTALAGAIFFLSRVPLPPDVPPAQTTFVYAADGKTRVASLDAGEDRQLVPLSQVPPVLVDAVLATEDKSFYRHRGVDPLGIVRATWADLRGKGRLQGGSTITQQYVKNVYLGRERTLVRKLKEAALAVKVEREFSKDEILERYLNTIYFGRGAYGVQAASRAYFGINVEGLGLPEAAYLAGLIRAPEGADAKKADQLEVARVRRSRTLAAMARNAMITEEQRAAADADDFRVIDQKKDLAPDVARQDIGTPFFAEYVRAQLVRTYGEAKTYGGGLQVTTTLDLKTQEQANGAVCGFLDRPTDPPGALVAVDDAGRVRAMVGGCKWGDDPSQGQSKVNLAVGAEGGGTGRQAGSTFKPFLLAEVVAEGYTVESALPAPAEIVLEGADAGKDWTVPNYDGASFGRSLNLIDATRNSVNTVYAQLVMAIGPEKLVERAHDLGIRSNLEPVPSLVLGTADVSPLEMAGAYSTFARRGEYVQPHVIEKVRDADGTVLYEANPERRRALDEGDADVVNFVLRQAVERGTGTAARVPGRQIAGKTGTTNDYADAWFVGYTPKLTAAVWMGYPEGGAEHPMTNVRGRKVSGGSFPAQIFRRFMAEAAGPDSGTFPEVRKFPGKVVRANRVAFSTTTSAPSAKRPVTTTTSRRRTATSRRSATTAARDDAPATSVPTSAGGDTGRDDTDPPAAEPDDATSAPPSTRDGAPSSSLPPSAPRRSSPSTTAVPTTAAPRPPATTARPATSARPAAP